MSVCMWGPDAQEAGLNARWLMSRSVVGWNLGRPSGRERGAQSYTPGCDLTRLGSYRHDIEQ